MIEMINVQSSNLEAVGYDDKHNILVVEFKHGGTYQYISVDKSIYENLLLADSKGKFFDQYVKKAGYQYSKV